jgi:hypothetical protein
MKPKPLLLLFILIAQYTFSQSLESLKVATNKIYEANYLMDFETIASLSYPKIYEEHGKDAFIELLDLQYQNTEYRVRLQLEKVPFQYGTIKKIEGKSFCVITCRNPMRYFFETKLTTETAAEKKAWIEKINNTKEVTFEPNRNSFNVNKKSTFVAVMDETTNNEWKFFNFDDVNQLERFQLLFDKSVKKELGL